MNDEYSKALAREEYRALRAELLMRIAIQNLIILGAAAIFALFVTLIFCFRDSVATVALAHSVVTLAMALHWCHQGVRQCALKQAVLAHDGQVGRKDSWENWLPRQRPTGPLGSRWFISTKAVFIGLNATTILLAIQNFSVSLWVAFGLLVLTTYFLLTNPKE